MKNIIMIAVIVAAIGGVFAMLSYDNAKKDAQWCEVMEKQVEFSGETVDKLFHFKRVCNPSKKFLDLYNKKIKDLPGWSYGDTRVDR